VKAGLVEMLDAIGSINDSDGVTVVVTSDEEIGSHFSRELIETEATSAHHSHIAEPSADGAIKIERKGVFLYELEVIGRAAHAGLEPERGVNAAVEPAHQILATSSLVKPGVATTITPTVLLGGTTTNTVRAAGRAAIDVHSASTLEQDRVDAVLRGLAPVLGGAALGLHGGPNRLPLEAAMSEPLVALCQRAATAIGIDPPGTVSVGGGSDANFTAGVDTLTLDGLGTVGGGAQSDDEHMLVTSMTARAGPLAALLSFLFGSDPREDRS